MSKKVDAIKKVAVALGYGSSVSEYTSRTTAGVLKEIAVKMECATSVDNIRCNTTTDVLSYIAENYGSEEKEPYDLARTATKATVVVKRGKKALDDASDILYNGDKLKITAEPDEGCELSSLTVNGEAFTSGETFTVSGKVTIAATATETPSEEGDS